MSRPTICVLVIAACAIATCVSGEAAAQEVDEVRTSFEGSAIPVEFVACHRPESAIAISTDRAKSGRRSLSLAITERPLFPPPEAVSWSPSSQFCLRPDRLDEYRSDDAERAELWENKDFAPEFGQEGWYGFSMWVDRASAPYGDFNRVVLGQWKASYSPESEVDFSPFLAQRLTGGFFHITLDVDARERGNEHGDPMTCRLLLAFTDGPPSPMDPELTLDRAVACETRLRQGDRDLVPSRPIVIERKAYLPRPFDRWTDMIFRVKGGPDGIVQVWADGTLVATAKGWIGHESGLGTRQYFKFGPYRDPAANEFLVYLDDLARGNSKEYVDPSQ